MKCPPLDIVLTVEELSMDSEICLGRCSRSTAYHRYDWRVKLTIDKTAFMPYSLTVI